MDYVLNLLAERGYQPLNPDDLRNLKIVRTELCDGEYYTGEKHAPIIIEDTTKIAPKRYHTPDYKWHHHQNAKYTSDSNCHDIP